MADNFDLRKYLAENKLTSNSKLNQEEIIDIIDSENSGLSAEQRLDEINRLIKDFNTKER